MNILYLSYWGLDDGLTQSTVLPHLTILSQFDQVEKIIFLTIERNGTPKQNVMVAKVQHLPLGSIKFRLNLITKVMDFIRFPRIVRELLASQQIDHMICRSSMAGTIGYLANKDNKVAWTVESFEPHADYMLDAKVWRKYGLMYQMQKHWEKRQLHHATHIIVVSQQYAKFLTTNFLRLDTHVFGCAVDVQRFAFDVVARTKVRKQLGLHDHNLVGIYVGKFGDIYLGDEAFLIFKAAADFFGDDFFLIVLSPMSPTWITEKLLAVGIRQSQFYINSVSYHEVPDYLSASDLAFSMIRPASVRKYCSPIKDGEYWANGLPTLIPSDIGDDSAIIVANNAGAILELDGSSNEAAFAKIQAILDNIPKHQHRPLHIDKIAKLHRSIDGLVPLYQEILGV